MQKQSLKKKQMDSIHSLKKADLILIIGCLAAAILIGVFFVLHHSEGRMARILCEGNEIAGITFGESKEGLAEQYYLIRITDSDAIMEAFDEYPVLPDEDSFNLISVIDGRVSMEAADCRDQICVRHRPVSGGGESIICLPHKLVIEIADDSVRGRESAEESQESENRNTDKDTVLDGVVE